MLQRMLYMATVHVDANERTFLPVQEADVNLFVGRSRGLQQQIVREDARKFPTCIEYTLAPQVKVDGSKFVVAVVQPVLLCSSVLGELFSNHSLTVRLYLPIVPDLMTLRI
jgi:hypothetical protein